MMGCGPGIGGALMDDLIYARLWLVDDEEEASGSQRSRAKQEEDSDIRKLFPTKDGKKTSISKVSKKGTPEWLAMSVGVFFVGALFTIASYQVYSGNFSDELSHIVIHNDIPEIFSDAPESDETYSEIKLPTTLIPESYKLYIGINVAESKYRGIVTILMNCKQNTDRVILHSARHKIVNITLKSVEDNKSVFIKSRFRNSHNDMLVLSLNETLQAGRQYVLLLAFSNDLYNSFNNGIYRAEYKDINGTTRYLVSMDLEPTRARYAYPCFDEPALKASWKIMVHPHDKGYYAISNMPLEKKVPLNADKDSFEYFFKPTPKMSTYIVNFAVSEYQYVKGVSKRGLPVRVFCPIGRLDEAKQALKWAMFSVDYFSQHFGINYTLPKLDMPVLTWLPEFMQEPLLYYVTSDLTPSDQASGSAEENWGNIVFLSSSLLVEKNKTSQSSFKYAFNTIAHEISHMWFGDLVTMKWWNDLWIKESFADYLANFPVQAYYPSWDASTEIFSSAMSAMVFDSSKYTHPIKSSSEIDPKALTSSYDAITYQKGSAIVNMVAKFVGARDFWKGLRNFLGKHKFQSVAADQLWTSLGELNKAIDVKAMMKTWVDLPGFPLITVKIVNNQLTFEQQLFQYNGKDKTQTVNSKIWQVPFYVHICGKLYRYLLKGKHGAFNLDAGCDVSKPYKVNYGSNGYYHVHYADKNWLSLSQQLKTKHTDLPAIDRAGLLFDIYSLMKFNYMDVGFALNFTEYLSDERDITALRIGMETLGYVRHIFYTDAKIKSCIEEYSKKKMEPLFAYLRPLKHHDHNQVSLIQLSFAYALSYKNKRVVSVLENQFYLWAISNNTVTLPVNEKSIILHAGVLTCESGFNRVWDMWKASKEHSVKMIYLRALSRVKDPLLIDRVLKDVVASLNARGFQNLCSNRHARVKTFQAIKTNWDKLKSKLKYSTGLLHYIIDSCLRGGSTDDDLKEAQDFLENYKLERWQVFVKRSIETIKRNIEFAKQKKSDVEKWCLQHESL